MALNDFYGRAREIAECIGEEEARILLEARGGTYIDLPKALFGSLVENLIGDIAARKLVAKFGTGRLELPMGPHMGLAGRRARAKKLLKQGHSVSAVARSCGFTYRTVSNYRGQLQLAQSEPQQLQLPLEFKAD